MYTGGWIDLRRKILVLILLIAAIFLIANVQLFETNAKQFNMSAQAILVTSADTKIGVAAQTDELNFGRIPLGGKSTKLIDISNGFKSRAKIKMKMSGNISEYIELSENETLLGPEEIKQIRIMFNSKDAGNYTGKLEITTYLSKSGFSDPLLKYI